MSKNFELMQRIGLEPEAEIKTRTSPRLPVIEPKVPRLRNGDLPKLEQVALDQTLRLVQRVFMVQTPDAPRVVAFAGIEQGSGCSQVCSMAAKVLAKNVAGSVCLVDANLRSPALANSFRIPNRHGLSDALREPESVKTFVGQLGAENLWLLSAGSFPEESFSLLNSSRLKERFAELRAEFDYIVIDAPPLTQFADVTALGQLSDGLVMILEANSTRREAALDVARNLRAAQIRILGAVLDKRTFPIPDSLYRRI
jgi:Mrp family chromosome partitioning ATPase